MPQNFTVPQVQSNPDGWGPCTIAEQYKDMPYQPFSKSDRIGKVADWTGQTYVDKRLANKYLSQYGTGGTYAYFQEEDDAQYQLVDTSRGPTKLQRKHLRVPQRNLRGRGKGPGSNMQVLKSGLRSNVRNLNQMSRFKFSGKPGSRGRFDPKGQGAQKKREASIDVRPDWKIIEEMDFQRLSKLSLPLNIEAEDISKAGTLGFYDKSYDTVDCKRERRLQITDRVLNNVTTTDDPIIRNLSKSVGNVYATDAIIATIMCANRSEISWDIVVQRVGNKLFFDKREDNSTFDLLTVNETAAEPPYCDDDPRNSINWPDQLALEATFINHNFTQQVIRHDEEHQFGNKNPFITSEADKMPSVGYRYRKFDLGDGVVLVCRCEHDAAIKVGKKIQYMNIKALNEWDSRCTGVDWRRKLDVQRGAVLANELKNNSCKLAKWTMRALLAGSDYLKLGYVSRVNSKDSQKHIILGVQQFKPKEFAEQIHINTDNAWGILRCVIDTCMKLKEGKYLILKDPNKPTLLLYDIPDDAFETDDESEEGGEAQNPEEDN